MSKSSSLDEFREFMLEQKSFQDAKQEWLTHLASCRACDIDNDCLACMISGESALEHACNCSKEPGAGYLLGKKYSKELAGALFRFQERRNRP